MTAGRDVQRAQVLAFLRGIQKAGRPIDTLADSDGLVASGLIDSLAVLQIVTWLESEHGAEKQEGSASRPRLRTARRGVLHRVLRQAPLVARERLG